MWVATTDLPFTESEGDPQHTDYRNIGDSEGADLSTGEMGNVAIEGMLEHNSWYM